MIFAVKDKISQIILRMTQFYSIQEKIKHLCNYLLIILEFSRKFTMNHLSFVVKHAMVTKTIMMTTKHNLNPVITITVQEKMDLIFFDHNIFKNFI